MRNHTKRSVTYRGATIATASLVAILAFGGSPASALVAHYDEPVDDIEVAQGEPDADAPKNTGIDVEDYVRKYLESMSATKSAHASAPQDGEESASDYEQPASDDAQTDLSVAVRYLDWGGSEQESPACADLTEALESDVLQAGWYHLDCDYTLDHDVQIEGEVNIVLRDADLKFAENGSLHVPSDALLRCYVGAGNGITPASGRLVGVGAEHLVVASGGRVEVIGAELCAASNNAVELSDAAQFALCRGTVMGCAGSGVSADDSSCIELADGSIVGNGGFGVTGGTLKLSGASVVNGNAKGDADPKGAFELVDRLTDGAKIGVVERAGSYFTTNYGAYNEGDDPARFFFSNAGKKVRLGADGCEVCIVAQEDLEYVGQNGKKQFLEGTWTDISDKSFKDAKGYELGDGWYVVRNSRTFNNRLNITGDAKLILCDGVTAKFKKGIRGKSGKLTIFAQSTGDNKGKLIANGCDESAGIGGNNDESNGTEIVICGGKIEAKGDDYGAGIGGGDHGGCGTIKIYGGDVSATGGCDPWYSAVLGGAAGIGSGDAAKSGGQVEIYGGVVYAKSKKYGAGIGTGDEAKKTVDVIIAGGDVTAEAGTDGAGIGGGNEVDGGIIKISGGKVIANGGENAAGIGGGDEGDGGDITISGGDVTAKSVHNVGTGIGGGANGWTTRPNGGDITITGGNVKAYGSSANSAIGGCKGSKPCTLTVSGGVVEASASAGDSTETKLSVINANWDGLHLYDYVVVNVDNNKVARGDARLGALRDWRHVRIEKQD